MLSRFPDQIPPKPLLECGFCGKAIQIEDWNKHQRKKHKLLSSEQYEKYVRLWEKAGKPRIKGNVVAYFLRNE